YIDIIFGHYISASAHTDCLNKLLKSIDLDALRRSQAAYYTQTRFEVKHILHFISGYLKVTFETLKHLYLAAVAVSVRSHYRDLVVPSKYFLSLMIKTYKTKRIRFKTPLYVQ
ncbi:hypothetical protein, partial [Moritella sp.]|uniref:hypothetical protein n=1 Tax=Moritella sp. TaxID=78556 RepID=UPI0025D28FA3